MRFSLYPPLPPPSFHPTFALRFPPPPFIGQPPCDLELSSFSPTKVDSLFLPDDWFFFHSSLESLQFCAGGKGVLFCWQFFVSFFFSFFDFLSRKKLATHFMDSFFFSLPFVQELFRHVLDPSIPLLPLARQLKFHCALRTEPLNECVFLSA